MKKLIALTFAGLLVVGCAGAVPGNPQGKAGLTDVDVRWNPETGKLDRVLFTDGKEKAAVDMKVDLKAGTVEYSAGGVLAFEAFRSRADVEAAVSRDLAGIFDEQGLGVITNFIAKLAGVE